MMPAISSMLRDDTPVLTDAVFRSLRDRIRERSGIFFPDKKKYLLEGRVARRIRALHLESCEAYAAYLYDPAGSSEWPELCDAVTINETFFFRNQPQFDAFESILLPAVLEKRGNANQRIRIWSAASSTGEEAYSLAMIWHSRLQHRYPGLRLEIIGTDINRTVLESARSGVYSTYAVRNTPAEYLDRYFTVSGDRYILSEEIRSLVRFERLNLIDRTAMRSMRNFDFVFCCNVLIYFDTAGKTQVVSDLYNSLTPGGHLLIGYSELLHGISTAFRLITVPKSVAYRKE